MNFNATSYSINRDSPNNFYTFSTEVLPGRVVIYRMDGSNRKEMETPFNGGQGWHYRVATVINNNRALWLTAGSNGVWYSAATSAKDEFRWTAEKGVAFKLMEHNSYLIAHHRRKIVIENPRGIREKVTGEFGSWCEFKLEGDDLFMVDEESKRPWHVTNKVANEKWFIKTLV